MISLDTFTLNINIILGNVKSSEQTKMLEALLLSIQHLTSAY